MVNGYDPTTSTTAAAIENDVQRAHSAMLQDPELRQAQERAIYYKLAIVAGLALGVFLFVW